MYGVYGEGVVSNSASAHANGSLIFVLEISMSMMSPVLVGQLPKKVMKFSKKLRKTGRPHQNVLNHLQKAGIKKKLDVWVPRKFEPFLKRIITGDEKWVKYENIVGNRSWKKKWTITNNYKPGSTANKVMMCVWWDWRGIVHNELLLLGQYMNSVLYCERLKRLRQAIERKRPELINRNGVVLHHANAWLHTSLMSRQKLREFGWEVLMPPPYSPDITPSNYHLFRSLQNSLHGTKLASKEACENHFIQFFNQKPQKFYTDGIMALPEKLRNFFDNNGEYLVWINWS